VTHGTALTLTMWVSMLNLIAFWSNAVTRRDIPGKLYPSRLVSSPFKVNQSRRNEKSRWDTYIFVIMYLFSDIQRRSKKWKFCLRRVLNAPRWTSPSEFSNSELASKTRMMALSEGVRSSTIYTIVSTQSRWTDELTEKQMDWEIL